MTARRSSKSGARKRPSSPIPGRAVNAHPDAELIRLGKQWDARAQVDGQANDPTDTLDRDILKITARTMHGLAIQARVAAHWNEIQWHLEIDNAWTVIIARRFIEAVLRASSKPLPDGIASTWINCTDAPIVVSV